jgi:hypothetical protein
MSRTGWGTPIAEERTLECGCKQHWIDLNNSYGPTRITVAFCVLHGGETPYRGTDDEYFQKKVAMLKAEQSNLIGLIAAREQEARDKITRAEDLVKLRDEVSKLEQQNKELKAKLTTLQ